MLKIGIDEAGRGPWAGPVYASVVIINEDQELKLKKLGITDSKKISAKNREIFAKLIIENSIYYKVKYFTANQIDELGIYKSTMELIKSLVEEIDVKYLGNESKILIDGLFPKLELINNNKKINFETIIKGDQKEISISSASILAKVKRDQYMIKIHEKYPQYEFNKHKGYGTKLHVEKLKEFGICEEHRKSYKPIQMIYNPNNGNT